MADEPKTKPTGLSAQAFVATIEDAARRADCAQLVRWMEAATGEQGVVWGSNIVGFGTYRYAYASGRSGDWPVVAFSPRKNDLTVYIMPGFERFGALLERLGRHKLGRSCLYLKKLADTDPAVLQSLIEQSVAAMEPQRVRPTAAASPSTTRTRTS